MKTSLIHKEDFNNFSFLRILRLLIAINIFVLLFNTPVDAEISTISISNTTEKSGYSFQTSTDTNTINWTHFNFYSSGYNRLTEYYFIVESDTAFVNTSNSTSFLCVVGCTGVTGTVSYSKANKKFLWEFPPNTIITGNDINLTYTQNIFDANNIIPAPGEQASGSDAMSISRPMVITSINKRGMFSLKNGVFRRIFNHTATIGYSTSEIYNITYPINGNFTGTINKSGSIISNNTFENLTSILYTEGTFNINNISISNRRYNNSLYLNMSLSDGNFLRIQLLGFTYPITFTASGKITFLDVDNSVYDLPNALVYYNSTLYDYTDSNGDYSISGIPNGSVNLFVNKSNAYNIATISVSNTSTIGNAQLLFSKPLLSFPTLSGNYINTNYSHNFKAMNLWENPYFVWGIYTFGTGEIISNQCINSFSTTFQCDLPQNTNATFYFQYSDIYNYNLSNYHPTLTGHRIFNTSSISLLSGQIVNTEESVKSISLLSQEDREAYLSNSLPDIYLIMVIFITICIIISFLKRGKHE